MRLGFGLPLGASNPSPRNYITDPADLTSTAWTKTNATAPNATTLKAQNDSGTPHIHYSHQVVSGITTSETVDFIVEVHAGTKTWTFLQSGNGSTGAAYINLTTGAVGASVGTVTVTDAGSGWWRVTLRATLAASQDVNIFTANNNNAVNYADDGTGTIAVRFVGVFKI